MINFTLTKKSSIPRDKIYATSIDVENFSKIMPNYFESITITESRKDNNIIFTEEKINLFGTSSLNVKTKHVVVPPNVHKVYILSSLLQGSSFIEKYDDLGKNTKITIDVALKFNGISKIFLPLGFFIKRKMNSVMDEFLKSAEMNYNNSNDNDDDTNPVEDKRKKY